MKSPGDTFAVGKVIPCSFGLEQGDQFGYCSFDEVVSYVFEGLVLLLVMGAFLKLDLCADVDIKWG